jgi:hypothetical protein
MNGVGGFRLLAVVILVLGALSCVRVGGGGYPLYPNPERQRPLSEVAQLSGPIRSVDDSQVAEKGRTFAVLPGCHIVRTTTSVGGEGPGGWWSVHMPEMVYALRMKAGHRYKIDFEMEETSAPVGRVFAKAWEQDPTGARKGLSPAASTSEIDDCRTWVP